ncbi:helix-turn-helix domain-containing protein [Allomeiothermus silvanus]|nr:helix-turn-helix transcriptional regulator [Allomeiothermus silvanus]
MAASAGQIEYHFGKFLRHIREKYKFTQEDVARIIDKSTAYVSNAENGKLGADKIAAIIEAFIDHFLS